MCHEQVNQSEFDLQYKTTDLVQNSLVDENIDGWIISFGSPTVSAIQSVMQLIPILCLFFDAAMTSQWWHHKSSSYLITGSCGQQVCGRVMWLMSQCQHALGQKMDMSDLWPQNDTYNWPLTHIHILCQKAVELDTVIQQLHDDDNKECIRQLSSHYILQNVKDHIY